MIMYACDYCYEHEPESCGHCNRGDIRVTPDGKWLCECCYEYSDFESELIVPWSDLPLPPEYKPV